MAEPYVALSFGEILADIVVSSPARLILLYPGESVELPEVFKEQASNVAHPTT